MPIYVGSLKKRENSRKISTSVLLIMPKSLAVWITTKCGKFFKRIPDHLTCLLRNLYASQEATVRTGHGTTDWFQMGKGVHQGYILSPYLTYMQNISCKVPSGMSYKLESRLPGEISTILDMQMILL